MILIKFSFLPLFLFGLFFFFPEYTMDELQWKAATEYLLQWLELEDKVEDPVPAGQPRERRPSASTFVTSSTCHYKFGAGVQAYSHCIWSCSDPCLFDY